MAALWQTIHWIGHAPPPAWLAPLHQLLPRPLALAVELVGPLALLVLFSARSFSLMHDCGHNSLFRRRWLNQAVGVIATLGVILLSVTGAVMWWRRRPKGRLGTPPMPADKRLAAGVVVLILALCLFLPMAGVTLLAALVIDLLISAGQRFRGAPV